MNIHIRNLNEAMTHLKMKNWEKAETDATSALEIDPLHFKSYQRRCVARLSLGKVRAAMMDICSAEDSCMIAKGTDATGSAAQSSLAEIQKYRLKVEKALLDAAKGAPRRKMSL